MLFYLHYILITSGLSGTSVLLAVFFREYTDASQGEIGFLLMTFPFVNLFVKPLFSSMADRRQTHRLYLIYATIVELFGYLPFAVIPFFPQFYLNHPRYAWYILVLGCYLGNCGLGVAWSLGDCLAINFAQKKGTTFGQYRLMGTVGWGIYGFIIGQINETPSLPKYIPAFFILHASLLAEILLMCCWKAEDFVMFDTMASLESANNPNQLRRQSTAVDFNSLANSLPSSLGGTLRLNAQIAGAFRDSIVGADDLSKRLNVHAKESSKSLQIDETNKMKKSPLESKIVKGNNKIVNLNEKGGEREAEEERKNPQLVLLKMIFLADGRLIKYICLFVIIGILNAPMNFTFVSIEELCSRRGFNFSQLAGAILISQAAIETLFFMIMPKVSNYVSRSWCIAFTYSIIFAKYFFYANYFYNDDVSPYWAVLSEWGLGIGYGVFCTIQAEIALMFANESRLFIPELRRRGYLSEPTPDTPKEAIEAEERSIKMALRATMQAILDGFMNGLGQGVGSLVCGIFIELYSFITLWRLFYITTLTALIIHQLIEISNCRWSDTYKPRTGTKAFEIRQLTSKLREQRTESKSGSEDTSEQQQQKTTTPDDVKPVVCNA